MIGDRPTLATVRRVTLIDRTVAGFRPSAVRSVSRPTRILPPMRPPEPPRQPSRRDALRRWEEADEWSCAYCDASFTQRVVAEVDHVRPLARGGLHEWSNLAPSCALCNRLKADRNVTEWLLEPQVKASPSTTGRTRSGT